MNALTFKNGTVSAGDIFASSWGYEQTNVSFYQVISVHGKKTVIVREIRGKDEYTASMTGNTKPVTDDFIGEPLKRQVKDFADRPAIRIEEYETAYKTEADKSHRFSTYG